MSDLQPFADDLAATLLQTYQIPGFAGGAVLDGVSVWRAGHGTTRLGSGTPVTPRTLFHMASVTKPFVATATLQLVEQGRVDLDAPYSMYVPQFNIADPRGRTITIRQILTHTSGLPDVESYDWDRPQLDNGALERYIASLSHVRLLSSPGERFSYSDLGFDILGGLIANVAGCPFEEYVARNVLEPLGMHSSSLLLQAVDASLLASGHLLDERGCPRVAPVFPYNRPHAGSSTLYSNVDDMLRWGRAAVGQGELDGRRILRADTHALMWTPVIGNVHAAIPRSGRAGLGWFIFHRNNTRIVGHMGQDDGFASLLLIVPERRLALVSMVNRSYDYAQLGLWDLQFKLIDRVCGPHTS